MKSKTLTALAVAGAFAAGGAFAGGGLHHGKHHSGVEVQTPMSVNESAPWLANESHGAGWSTHPESSTIVGMHDGLHSDSIGASSSVGGSGSGGFDSMSSTGFDSSMTSFETSSIGGVEYWLLGDEATGMSSGIGGSGSGGFDSMSSLNVDESFSTADEYYLVSGPLAEFSGDQYILYESGTSADDIAYLSTLSEDFWILSPIEDEMADAGGFDESGQQFSQYSPLGSDEDLST